MATRREQRVCLVDTTLRDGAQSPGVALTAHQRVTIAKALDAIGIDEIEVGCPIMGEDERAAIGSIIGLGLRARITAWCRATLSDLDAAGTCGVDAVHLSVPGSDIQLDAMGKSWGWVEDALNELIPVARARFGFVSVGVMDASRSEAGRLSDIARRCQALDVDRLRLADTVGVWNPRTASEMVARVREATPGLVLGVHAHNDLGMAVGNTFAALEAGAQFADVTVLGLGERAGNAPLEELVMALQASGAMRCSVQREGLASLCDLVATAIDQSIPARKPIVGRNVFRHESGIHVRGMLRDERCFEPFGPSDVGRGSRTLELGTHSGRAGLIAALASVGIEADAAVLDALLAEVRSEAMRTRTVSPLRVALMHERLVAASQPRDHEATIERGVDSCVA